MSGKAKAKSLEKTQAATALTAIVMLVFRLEGNFMQAAEVISEPAGLTAARWKVLGGVLQGPRTVAEISQLMGLTRQSVQRLANILVDDGLAAFYDNPAHKSAKLLAATTGGLAAISLLRDRQTSWANEVSAGLGVQELERCIRMLKRIIEQVETTSSSDLLN